ncbi:MAG: hypothetical protein IPJ00_09210 [Saprospirales bacterium]|nr:hypothetical protein [Saprospirales bacterium]
MYPKQGSLLHRPISTKSWIGTSIEKEFSGATGCPVFAVNDARRRRDRLAHSFRRRKGISGTVIPDHDRFGLGLSLFYDGQLVPNTGGGAPVTSATGLPEHYTPPKLGNRMVSWKEWGNDLTNTSATWSAFFSPTCSCSEDGSNKIR